MLYNEAETELVICPSKAELSVPFKHATYRGIRLVFALSRFLRFLWSCVPCGLRYRAVAGDDRAMLAESIKRRLSDTIPLAALKPLTPRKESGTEFLERALLIM